MANKIQIKRGNAANRTSIVPAEGELIYLRDSKALYIGDGVTPGGVAPTNFQAAGSYALAGHTHSYLPLSGGVLTGNLYIQGQLHVGNVSGSYLVRDASEALHWQNSYGYIQIGPHNTSHCHFYTDRANYYFNKEIRVDSGYIGSYNEDLVLRRNGSNRIRVADTYVDVYADLKVNGSYIHVADGNNANVAPISRVFTSLGSTHGSDPYPKRYYKLCENTRTSSMSTTYIVRSDGDTNYNLGHFAALVSVSRYSGEAAGQLHVSVDHFYGSTAGVQVWVEKSAGKTIVWVGSDYIWGSLQAAVYHRYDAATPDIELSNVYRESTIGTMVRPGQSFDADSGVVESKPLWANTVTATHHLGSQTGVQTSGYAADFGNHIHMHDYGVNYVSQVHFNAGNKFQNNSSSYTDFRWADTGDGGLRFLDGDGVLHGYVYGNGSGDFGLLSGDGSWGVRLSDSLVGLYHNTNIYDSANLNMHGGNIYRYTHSSGYFIGGYNNVGENSKKTNPIFTIGSSYKPADTTLGNMYGIGYTHSNADFINSTDLGATPSSQWGMYVAADGNARIFLGASSGHGFFKGNVTAQEFFSRAEFTSSKTSGTVVSAGGNYSDLVGVNDAAGAGGGYLGGNGYYLRSGNATEQPKVHRAGTNYEIYHKGNKPTAADVGAATSSHNHDSSYLAKTAKAADSEKVDGYDSSALYRSTAAANAVAGAGWVTVARTISGRAHGEVYVTDGEGGDHSFIRIHWMRSYADSNFTVINVGGHANRITGVRVLRDGDITYGTKLLQVYVTTSSRYYVRIATPGAVDHYGSLTVITPVVQNSISGYSVQGITEALDAASIATSQGIVSGGRIYANGGVRLGVDDYLEFDGAGTYYMRESTGSYGTVAVYGRRNSWSGYSIEGRVCLMHDGGSASGLYNDVNNEWLVLCYHGGATHLYYDGTSKLYTSSGGGYLSGTWVCGDMQLSSDVRRKENFAPIDNALEKALAIGGYLFDWKETGERSAGIKAQELQAQVPEAVTEDDEGYLTVNPMGAIGVLFSAINELAEQVKELKEAQAK